MSEWFRPVPIALDNIAQAAKARISDPSDLKFTQHLSTSFSKKRWHHKFAATELNTNNTAL
jgi:hypothetical protein